MSDTPEPVGVLDSCPTPPLVWIALPDRSLATPYPLATQPRHAVVTTHFGARLSDGGQP